MITGIYKIENKINHKIYIGQSINIERRWRAHLNATQTHNNKLWAALNKYGKDNFDFSIIEECPKELLDEREQYWIKYYDSYNNGYNLTLGGDGKQTANYEEIKQAYEELGSILKVSKELGINLQTIRNALQYYHINYYDKSINLPKTVIMINPYTLEKEQIFSSIAKAADYVGINESSIRAVLYGKCDLAGGYYWQTLEEEKNLIPISKEYYDYILNKKKNNKTNKPKKILQYDINNTLIKEYKSLSAANTEMGKCKNNKAILNACQTNKLLYGYYWKIKT